ncbi:TPA: DUF1642 domain-containing protein [Streptococcus suis]|nr:DUF1642 domain-containing protein [Streptococcus suis]HEM6345119.1 DUF1642 domain-containing protein [Streptococcus suis]
MNKQEAINRVEELYGYGSRAKTVTDIISQIHVPQKAVVPKFVAEWIEYCKPNKLTLLGVFDPVSEHGFGLANTFTGEVRKGVDWAKRNQETFARAWLFGYEIEQEKLYTVEIPDPNSRYTYRFLSKNDRGAFIDGSCDDCWKDYNRNHLTESEIKQDFEWAWQFVKEVEEDK